jgi:hypothetical protein
MYVNKNIIYQIDLRYICGISKSLSVFQILLFELT